MFSGPPLTPTHDSGPLSSLVCQILFASFLYFDAIVHSTWPIGNRPLKLAIEASNKKEEPKGPETHRGKCSKEQISFRSKRLILAQLDTGVPKVQLGSLCAQFKFNESKSCRGNKSEEGKREKKSENANYDTKYMHYCLLTGHVLKNNLQPPNVEQLIFLTLMYYCRGTFTCHQVFHEFIFFSLSLSHTYSLVS